MTSLAILLVLSSAITHALWNFVAKRAIGGISFIWLFGIIEVVLYFPLVLPILLQPETTIGLIEYVMIIGSALFHTGYFFALIKGYQVADLSIVYPFSRGLGPLLATIGAILIFSERPSMLALGGTVLITFGIIGLTGDPRNIRTNKLTKGLFWAGLTGLFIAGYTLWDSYAVSVVKLSPIIYQWGVTLIRLIILMPFAFRMWGAVRLAWRHDRGKASAVAVLSSLSYILMLFALSISQVSYVAPLRSISILIGVVMGAYLLKEGNLQQRLGAASLMVLGAIALGLG